MRFRAAMQALQHSGCAVATDGVAESLVTPWLSHGCVDSGPAQLCMLVSEGALSCDIDFCADPSRCMHTGQCDATCKICHNRGESGRRALQIDLNSQCTLLSLASRVDSVNAACCDPARPDICRGGAIGAGVPTVCDARCAMVYNPFFEDCELVLRQNFNRQTMDAFSNLHGTCSSLPINSLLETVATATCDVPFFAAAPATTQGFGYWLDNALDCPLGMYETAVSEIDAACCSPFYCSISSKDGSPAECTPSCGAALQRHTAACANTMAVVLDGLDGTFDNDARVIDDLQSKCATIRPEDVLQRLKEKQDDGCVVMHADGVGETAVDSVVSSSEACADTAPKNLCSLVEKGLLKCSSDFCPSCAHAAACDKTCGFCKAEADNAATADGRRAVQQISLDAGQCPADQFVQRTEEVSDACCDDSNGMCSGGALRFDRITCDARCGMTYMTWYSDCNREISAAFPAEEQEAFYLLHEVCAAMPLGPLLKLLSDVQCLADPDEDYSTCLPLPESMQEDNNGASTAHGYSRLVYSTHASNIVRTQSSIRTFGLA